MPERARLARYIATSARRSSVSASPRVLGEGRDPHARVDHEPHAVEREGALEHRLQLGGQRPRGLGPGAGRQRDGELVAAQARHAGAVADEVVQSLAEIAQEVVAHVVAEGVVELLEAVEVEQEQATGGAVPARGLDLPLEEHVEPAPVGQLGEVVVGGVVAVALGLPAQRARGAPDDPEEHEPEADQAGGEQAVDGVRVVGDRRGDGPVGRVDLEGAGGAAVRAQVQRHVDLDEAAEPALVALLGVGAGRHAEVALAAEGLAQVVLDGEAAADDPGVVRPRDGAALGPHLHARQAAVGLGRGGDLRQAATGRGGHPAAAQVGGSDVGPHGLVGEQLGGVAGVDQRPVLGSGSRDSGRGRSRAGPGTRR